MWFCFFKKHMMCLQGIWWVTAQSPVVKNKTNVKWGSWIVAKKNRTHRPMKHSVCVCECDWGITQLLYMYRYYTVNDNVRLSYVCIHVSVCITKLNKSVFDGLFYFKIKMHEESVSDNMKQFAFKPKERLHVSRYSHLFWPCRLIWVTSANIWVGALTTAANEILTCGNNICVHKLGFNEVCWPDAELYSCHFIWWRYGGGRYEASVSHHTETVDLTGGDCARLPDILHLDGVDSGKQVDGLNTAITWSLTVFFCLSYSSSLIILSPFEIVMTMWT